MSIQKPDEYHEDGTRLFNPTRSHGTVYSDGGSEVKWVQNGIEYRGDRLPVGHVPSVKPSAKVAPKAAAN